MRNTIAAVIGLAILAGCGDKDDQVAFDGQYFRTKLDVGATPYEFTVSSSPASASVNGARQAAQYEAFTYCINQYGTSNIDWVVGPYQELDSYAIVNDTLTLQGRCPE